MNTKQNSLIRAGYGPALIRVVAGLLLASAGAFCQPACPYTQPPGVAQPLWNWRLLNNGKLPQTVFYQLPGDRLQITVEDGASMNLTDKQMVIRYPFTVASPFGSQISAYNCTPYGTVVASLTTGSMTLNETDWAPASTLVFSKPQWWGMANMYWLDVRYFWPMWSGKIVTINWTETGSDPFTGQISSYQLPASCPVTTSLSSPPTLAPCLPMIPIRLGEFFDWDRHADRVVFQNGQWSVKVTDSGAVPVPRAWGLPGDIPVPADYDADGRTDLAVWRPSTGEWWVTSSNNGLPSIRQWGMAGDIPMPGDYDGDGKVDLAVYRPSTGAWWINNSSNGATRTVQWGMAGDIPVRGDFDGDGKNDPAIWRPSTGEWWISLSTSRFPRIVQWGTSGDVPVPGDYDGDGKTDMAVWRPSTGVWWFINSSNGAMLTTQWGQNGDVPVPADYDGDGKTDLAIWRSFNPSTLQTGEWWTIGSRDGSRSSVSFGLASDKPVPTR